MKLSEIPRRTFFLGKITNHVNVKLYFKAYNGVFCVDPLDNPNRNHNHDITNNVASFDSFVIDYKPVRVLIESEI